MAEQQSTIIYEYQSITCATATQTNRDPRKCRIGVVMDLLPQKEPEEG